MLLKVATALLAVAAVSLFLLQLASTEAASALLVVGVGVDTDTTGWPARITVAVVVTVATSVWLCCLRETGEGPMGGVIQKENADEAKGVAGLEGAKNTELAKPPGDSSGGPARLICKPCVDAAPSTGVADSAAQEALAEATSEGDCDKISEMISSGTAVINGTTAVDLDDGSGEAETQQWTALHVAARMGLVDAARLLLDLGSDPSFTAAQGGLTPLMVAIIGSSGRVVNLHCLPLSSPSQHHNRVLINTSHLALVAARTSSRCC